MTEKPLNYQSYLKIHELIQLQKPVSVAAGNEAHDEMLFIVVHQAYELWFKLIIHELDSIVAMFQDNFVDECNIGIATARLHRITEIQGILIAQIKVLETMTPLDFLDFRNLLGTASGFQSLQFRLVENKLGLKPEQRLLYSTRPYSDSFSDEEKAAILESERNPNLFSVVERWLERIPFLELKGFNFLDGYHKAVNDLYAKERDTLSPGMNISEVVKKEKLNALKASQDNFAAIFDAQEYEKLREKGEKRLSYRATIAALFISLYRDQPLLQQPFRFLEAIIETDERLTLWRYQHALMVLRMLGRRFGTGGSSGHDYLRETVEKHRVFSDLFALSTCLIPRSQLPELPRTLKDTLAFHYSVTRPE